MGRCKSPPPPLGQRGIRFRGPFFETNSIRVLTAVARINRMARHSIAERIPAGSEDVDYWPTTNGFVAVEDKGDQRRKSLSIAPNIKLEDYKLAEQAADTAITFLDVAEHAPQRSFSPPRFSEMKDRRVGSILARRQLVQRRSIAKRIPAGSEDVDYWPTTNGFVAIEDEGDQGSRSLSITLNLQLDDIEIIEIVEQPADTAISFQTQLAPQRFVSPPHFLDVAEHAPQRSISPPPFFEMKHKRVGAILARRQLVQSRSVAKKIPAGSEDVDQWPTTNGFVAVEDEGDQGRQSLSIAPNIKLKDIKLDEQAADTAITFQTRLAPQRSVSPPHFLDVAEHAPQRSISPHPSFEMKDRRVGAILARRQLVQRRYEPDDFASLTENGGREERNYRTNHSSNASVGAITSPYQEAPSLKSTRLPLPPTRRTTIDFTPCLAPPPARRQTVIGLIASIFKKKRQMESFVIPVEKEQSVEVEPGPTSFGLARIFSYEELEEATSSFKQQIGDGGFSSVYLDKLGIQITRMLCATHSSRSTSKHNEGKQDGEWSITDNALEILDGDQLSEAIRIYFSMEVGDNDNAGDNDEHNNQSIS